MSFVWLVCLPEPVAISRFSGVLVAYDNRERSNLQTLANQSLVLLVSLERSKCRDPMFVWILKQHIMSNDIKATKHGEDRVVIFHTSSEQGFACKDAGLHKNSCLSSW